VVDVVNAKLNARLVNLFAAPANPFLIGVHPSFNTSRKSTNEIHSRLMPVITKGHPPMTRA
jgi:hypothetical protein